MNSIYEQDISFAVDMDDLGVRPIDWYRINKTLNSPIDDFFGNEKTVDFTVYSAQVQLANNGNKSTTNEDETSMSVVDDDDDDDDQGNHDYEIDPETGEKIFHETTLTSNIPPSSPNDKWIEEYLLNIESSSSNQLMPTTTTTTTNNSPLMFENITFSSIENLNTDSDWFSNLFDLDENSDSMMFTDSILNSNEFLGDNSVKSNQTTMENPLSFSVTTDDEYSTSNSSSQQQRSYTSLEANDEITLVEAKLEKIEHDEIAKPRMFVRRTSTRTPSQGQQDADALRLNNIPLELHDITHSSTEEYNRHLIRLNYLTPEQIHIIKDIRRRGKNKIAAQNCRKRKAVSVESLSEEVDELKRVKYELEERKRLYQQQIAETRHEYEYLHRQVLPDRQLPPAIIVK